MMQWYYMVIMAFALLVFLLYREWKREKKSRLYGRLLAAAVAVLSLLAMALPHTAPPKSSPANKLVIITDGFIKDSVDDFLQAQPASVPVYAYNTALQYPGKNIQLLASWKSFAARHAADSFHVFGSGMDETALSLLNGHPIIFHAPYGMAAVTNISWNQNLTTGEVLKVQGSYENKTAGKIKIVLAAFGDARDTLTVAPGTTQQFSLVTTPLHTGRAVYKLLCLAGKDTLQQEPVPVDVQPVVPLQVLMIAASPDFDNTYLKNHLSQLGYRISSSTVLSTHTTDRQFLNTPVQQAGAVFSNGYLSRFDVVMADQAALQQMNAASLAALRAVIAEEGTGLLVKIEAQKSNAAFYSAPFTLRAVPQDKEVYRWLQPAGSDSSRYKIKMGAPLSIVHEPGQQVILKDAQSNIYAAAALYGRGKIVASTLQNTFSMALAGDRASWQSLWALLLGKAARKIYPAETWQSGAFIPIQDDPVQMQVEKADTLLTDAVAGNEKFMLYQNEWMPYLWQGVYWPQQKGWQYLPQVNTNSGSWYVFGKNDWQQLFHYRRTMATRQYEESHPPAAGSTLLPAENTFMRAGRFWWLLFFLAACIFLWVEQKLG